MLHCQYAVNKWAPARRQRAQSHIAQRVWGGSTHTTRDPRRFRHFARIFLGVLRRATLALEYRPCSHPLLSN